MPEAKCVTATVMIIIRCKTGSNKPLIDWMNTIRNKLKSQIFDEIADGNKWILHNNSCKLKFINGRFCFWEWQNSLVRVFSHCNSQKMLVFVFFVVGSLMNVYVYHFSNEKYLF